MTICYKFKNDKKVRTSISEGIHINLKGACLCFFIIKKIKNVFQ